MALTAILDTDVQNALNAVNTGLRIDKKEGDFAVIGEFCLDTLDLLRLYPIFLQSSVRPPLL